MHDVFILTGVLTINSGHCNDNACCCAGMNFYKVNRRTGKLIALTTGLQMGESDEITVSPGKTIIIKVCRSLYDLLPVYTTLSGPRHHMLI